MFHRHKIIFVDKLLVLHLIPQWNYSNDKFVSICNENVDMADGTTKYPGEIINFSLHV